MMGMFPDRQKVEELRRKYPEGAGVELVRMDDPYRKMPPGLKGTVMYVDDAGQIHVNWENGSTLAVLPGVDECKLITE